MGAILQKDRRSPLTTGLVVCAVGVAWIAIYGWLSASEADVRSEHVYQALLSANERMGLFLQGNDLDITNEFKAAIGGDNFRQIVQQMTDLSHAPYRADFKFEPGKTYVYSLSQSNLDALPIPRSNYHRRFLPLPRTYAFTLGMKYRSDTDFDIERAAISNVQDWL